MDLPIEEIRGVVARGWCTPKNSHKIMDGDLAEAISQEIFILLEETKRIRYLERIDELQNCPK